MGRSYAEGMRTRLFWLSASVAISLLGVVEACGDSSSTPSDTGNGDATTPDTSSTFDSAQPDTNTGPTPDATNEAAVPDSGPGFDADFGDVTLFDAQFEGGIPCVAGGTIEIEPNDNGPFGPDGGDGGAPTAVPEGVICGVVSPGTDVDWFVHALRANAGGLNVVFSGNVKIVLSVDELDGGTQDLATFQPGGGFQNYTVFPGRNHFLKVTSFDGNQQTYLIRLQVP
jgi:hypothetical protein